MKKDAQASANLLERLSHLSRSDTQTDNLNPAQWAALRYLAQANRFSRTPIALTRYLGTTRGTTSQTLMALERKGFVNRKSSKQDKRSINIGLTKKGLAQLSRDPILRLVAMIEATFGTGCATFRAQLSAILKRMVEANNGQMFGVCMTCRHFRQNGGNSAKNPHLCGLLRVGLSESDSEKICVEQEP